MPHIKLPAYANDFIKRNSTSCAKQVVTHFHYWIAKNNLQLAHLTVEYIQDFLRKPYKKRIKPATQKQYCYVLKRYLTELYLKNKITIYPGDFLEKQTLPLPAITEQYLNECARAHITRLITFFHCWLDNQDVSLETLSSSQVQRFITKPRKKTLTHATQRNYGNIILTYLEYVYVKDRDLLLFNPSLLRPKPKQLPEYALQFLNELAITLKPATVNHYRTTLRKFYGFLEKRAHRIEDIDRECLVAWFTQLKLHPSTRRSALINLRSHFRWLRERNIITVDPDELIRKTDLPKLPDYLPRPLPPKVDLELQKRLARSRHLYAQALLLMRKTGIRIGELVALEFDCLRSDPLGNHYIKVPLGKMNTERLVPLDQETIDLIGRIKNRKPAPRKYLIATTKTLKEKPFNITTLLKKLSKKLKLSTHIQSHQLRHSCATELLNAGMDTPALMRFLGHKDHRMTFRYARIAQNTLTHQFKEARTHIELRYQQLQRNDEHEQPDPALLISKIITLKN